MIRKKVYSPILFFVLLLIVCSCNNAIKDDGKKYKAALHKGDEFFEKKVHLDSAFYYFNLAKEYSTDKSGEDHTYALLQIATVQQYIGDYFGSEETITDALANYKGTVYKPYLYNILAVAYDKQGKFDDALQYYKKAYSSFEDSTAKILAHNNIGLMYQKKGQHQKAIQVLKPLLEKQNRKIDIALILSNLGYSQFKLNRPEAYSNLLKSLQLTDSLHDVIGSITTNIHLSEFFNDKDKLKSKQYALNALNASKAVNDPDEQLESLKWLIESSDGMDAKVYSIDFIKLNDRINLSKSSAKNQFAKIKYDSKKAIETGQKYKMKMWVALGLTILITFSAILLFYYIRKRAREKLKGSVNETETRIAKKIHDELANDVYQAIAFTETQNLEHPENKEVLLDNLSNIYSKARDISQTNSAVYTDERYPDVLLDLINSFSGNDINIITKDYDRVDWNKINEHSKNALYRVIQELLVNMKKHSEADLVMLDFESKPKVLEIRYSDNGKGIDPAKFSKKGLQYAENRIHAVNGTITFDKKVTKGFRVIVQIPK